MRAEGSHVFDLLVDPHSSQNGSDPLPELCGTRRQLLISRDTPNRRVANEEASGDKRVAIGLGGSLWRSLSSRETLQPALECTAQPL